MDLVLLTHNVSTENPVLDILMLVTVMQAEDAEANGEKAESQ
ncbi:hypothetical protein [Paenibacillus xanthanilyticus]|uniref:Uncharacterized protein n=1 Tax=Paenibacillus xanthanilyticus TaxID=1783531 RepID=A0ABV8JZ95_9BACL